MGNKYNQPLELSGGIQHRHELPRLCSIHMALVPHEPASTLHSIAVFLSRLLGRNGQAKEKERAKVDGNAKMPQVKCFAPPGCCALYDHSR